jgi:hypothetical protein
MKKSLGDQLRGLTGLTHEKKKKQQQQTIAGSTAPKAPKAPKAPLLGEKLKQLAGREESARFEEENPESIILKQLRQILSQTLEDEKRLEEEAKKGNYEIVLLRFSSLLEDKRLSHLSMEEVVSLMKKIVAKPEKDVQTKGLHLVVHGLWFQNYVSLSWK